MSQRIPINQTAPLLLRRRGHRPRQGLRRGRQRGDLPPQAGNRSHQESWTCLTLHVKPCKFSIVMPNLQGDRSPPPPSPPRASRPLSRRGPARSAAGGQDDLGESLPRRQRRALPRSRKPARHPQALRPRALSLPTRDPARGARWNPAGARALSVLTRPDRRRPDPRLAGGPLPATRVGFTGTHSTKQRDARRTHRLPGTPSTRRHRNRRRTGGAAVAARRLPRQLPRGN